MHHKISSLFITLPLLCLLILAGLWLASPEPAEGHPEPAEGHPELAEGHPELAEGHPIELTMPQFAEAVPRQARDSPIDAQLSLTNHTAAPTLSESTGNPRSSGGEKLELVA